MQKNSTITTDQLRQMLSSGQAVNVIDIRPMNERADWFIPGSIHADVYDKLKQGDATPLDELELDKSVPVVTVCAGGKTSMIAAEMLQQKGYNAFSLQEGMKSWSLAWNTARLSFAGIEVVQVRRTGKGCLSYIIASNNEAIIIDASLPVDVYENILEQYKWQLKLVAETHIHADHLSRSKELADNNNIVLYLPAPNKVVFEHQPIRNGQTFRLGKIELKTITSPGHTTESVSFLLNNKLLFTGDTLFTNSIGRPDLKATDEETRHRAALLYDSLQLLMNMNDDTIILPAHTNAPVNFDNKPVMATLGEIKNKVSILQLSKEDFIKTLLVKLPPTPANFLAITERNLTGDFAGISPADLEAGANRCAVSSLTILRKTNESHR